MDIDLELLGGFGEIALERRVAGDAGVSGWRSKGSTEEEKHQGDKGYGILHGALPQG
jgi:hypothetical protein